jgi:triphosphoribosyl-dephospho-CoA synthase
LRKPNHAEEIAQSLQLAILLEASAHKPGNISVVTNFEKTRYEHFLASAVAVFSSFESAAKRGIRVSQRKADAKDVEVGKLIKKSVADINAWQHGGNTLLGTVILLSPMAIAAGMIPETNSFDPFRMRENLKLIVEATTPEDAVNVYEAIKIANPSGLGAAPDLDINDPKSTKKILDQKISLYEVFKIAEKYDTVCSEWVNNYPITFDVALPALNKGLEKDGTPEDAIVHTFLEVLVEQPDTLIARKAGNGKAEEVSRMAKEILKNGFETTDAKRLLKELDRKLRKESNILNPGTTADILAAALAITVLNGYRP